MKNVQSAVGWTEQEIIDDARQFKTRGEWSVNRSALYARAYYKGFLNKIHGFLPESQSYSTQELLDNARKYPNVHEWRQAGQRLNSEGKPSHFIVACKQGPEFYKQCTAHMKRKKALNPGRRPIKYTDGELKLSAAKYQHKGHWKKSDNQHYQTALRRGQSFFDECTAHMTPAANPYAGDYIIYGYFFSDGRIYIGLTFKPESRHNDHMAYGPVFKHHQLGHTFEYKVLQAGIKSPKEAADAEKRWLASHPPSVLLNQCDGGSLGMVARKWTKELLQEQASKFSTRKDWYLGSQYTYITAKRMSVFDEICNAVGMQRYSLRVARHVVTEETRQKMRARKLGTKMTDEHRKAISSAHLRRSVLRREP